MSQDEPATRADPAPKGGDSPAPAIQRNGPPPGESPTAAPGDDPPRGESAPARPEESTPPRESAPAPGTPPPASPARPAPRASLLGVAFGPFAKLLGSILDSPVAEMDARELLASWRVGIWLGGLLVVLAFFSGGAALMIRGSSFREDIGRLGVGAYLVAATQLGLAVFLTLAVPVRTAGLLEGPRWRGYFEQLVVSGITPWRYFAGRALVGQAFIAVVLVASAPVLVTFALIDPPPLGQVVLVVVLLWAYAELLLAMTLGLSVLVHEVLAGLATVLGAVIVGFFAWAPIPTAIVAITPVRAILAPFARSVTYPAGAEILSAAPCLFGLKLPYAPYALALTLALSAIALLSCVFGPLHSFAPGLNSFGAVVLPGDRKRAALRRIRPFLTRRAEIAFFFENHGPVGAFLAPWARAAQIGGLLTILGSIPLASSLNETFLRATRWPGAEEILVTVATTFSLWAVVAVFLLATSRSDARLSLRLGSLAFPLVLADLLLYVGVAFVLVLVTAVSLVLMVPFFASPAFSLRQFKTAYELATTALEWSLVVSTTGLLALIVQKVVGLRTWGRRPGIFIAITGVLALQGVPFMVVKFEDLEDRTQKERDIVRTPEENARALARLHLSCAMRMIVTADPKSFDDVRLPGSGVWLWLSRYGFWVVYPGMELLLALAVLRLIVTRRREARAELVTAEPKP